MSKRTAILYQAVRVGDSWAVELTHNGRKQVGLVRYSSEGEAMDRAIAYAEIENESQGMKTFRAFEVDNA